MRVVDSAARRGLTAILAAALLASGLSVADAVLPGSAASPAAAAGAGGTDPDLESHVGEPEPPGAVPVQKWEAPAASSDVVVLDATADPVGESPVAVGADDELTGSGRRVEVEVLPQDVADALGVSGFVFRVVDLTASEALAEEAASEPAAAGEGPVLFEGDTSTGETLPEETSDSTTTTSTTSTTTPDPADDPPPSDEPAPGPATEEPSAATVPAAVNLTIDYSSFEGRFGAGFGGRLRLVELPACVLEVPVLEGCVRTGRVIPTRNDAAADELVVDGYVASIDDSVEVPEEAGSLEDGSEPPQDSEEVSAQSLSGSGGGGGSVLALTSGGDGGAMGSFNATPLQLSSSWNVGVGSGEFSWSYPVPAQPGPAGDVASMALSYSSAAVDGMVGGNNNQASPIGSGWSLSENFIERQYKNCASDGQGWTDLCWETDNATLVLNGVSTELVISGTTIRAKDDPNWMITRHTTGTNGDNDNEFWLVRTPDGTKYYFGRGTSETGSATNSAWTVPVFGNEAGEPCNGSWPSPCDQAWRWNLDRIEDPNSNVTTLFYETETNQYASKGGSGPLLSYTRGGHLDTINWGIRAGSATASLSRLDFTYAYRCNTLSTGCGAPTPSNGASFPDVPNDLICTGTPCSNFTPSFFSGVRLHQIASEVRNGSVWDKLDEVQTTQQFVGNGEDQDGDGEDTKLLLRDIDREGFIPGGAQTAFPTLKVFHTLLPNRADPNPGVGVLELKHHRVDEIVTEYGSTIRVDYGQPNSCDSPPSSGFDTNVLNCFPRWWVPPAGTAGFAVFDKYVVTQMTVDDDVASQPDLVTTYEYDATGGAWHYDNDPFEPAGSATRTWSDWRGYKTVKVIKGSGATQTTTRHRVYRGMDGDRLAGGGSKNVTLTLLDGTGSFTDADWYRGKTLDQSGLNTAGSEMSGVQHTWMSAVTNSGGGKTARWTAESYTTRRLRSGGIGGTIETGYTYNADRLVENVQEYGWDSTTEPNPDGRCTTTLYATDPAAWMLAYPSEVVVRPGLCADGQSPLRRQRSYYDNQAWDVIGADGDLSRDRLYTVGITAYSDTEIIYDSLGRVINVEDPLDRDLASLYVPATGWADRTEVTNAKGHVTKTYFDPERRSAVIKVTDPDGNPTEFAYDPVGRLRKVWKPGDVAPSGTPSVEHIYTLSEDPVDGYGAAAPAMVTSRTLQSAGLTLDTTVVYDGLLRVRQSRSISPEADGTTGSGAVLATTTRYDSRGLGLATSLPQPVPGASLYTADVLSVAGGWANEHQLTYDELERPTNDAFTYAGSTLWSTTTGYGLRTSTVTPPVGAATRATTDVYGNATKIEEGAGTFATTATYGYNRVGDLLTITDAAANTITYTPDLAGRRIAMADPDAGNWSYQYDAAGNQTLVTDALLASLFTQYDTLNRPEKRYVGNASGTLLADWTYDTVKKGQLSQSRRYDPTYGTFTTAMTAFDSRSRLTAKTVTLPTSLAATFGGPFTFGYGYDKADHPTSVTYPAAGGLAAEAVTTSYTDLGVPDQLTSPLDSYVSDSTYDSRARVATRRLGLASSTHHVLRTYGYDGPTQRLTRWLATKPANGPTTIQDDQLTLDSIGNVRARLDNIPRPTPSDPVQRECFNYDTRNRLTSAWTSTAAACPASAPASGGGAGQAPYNHTYAYCTDGRISQRVQKTGTSTTTKFTFGYPAPGSPRPHAVTSIGTGTPTCTANGGTGAYTYDTNGNMTARPEAGTAQALTWNTEHRLAQVDANGAPTGAETNFVYDPDGTRLIRKTPANTTLYIDGHELTLTGTTLTTKRYYSLGGVNVGVRESASGQLTYLLGDNLGSTSVSVNATTGAVATQRYLPYGGIRSGGGSLPTDRGFIGQVKDGSTGLQYLNARYYDPVIGRFTATDPLADLGSPGSLDAYGYALDSPTTLTDSSGLIAGGPCVALFDCSGNGSDPGIISNPGLSTDPVDTEPGLDQLATIPIPRWPGHGVTRVNLFISDHDVCLLGDFIDAACGYGDDREFLRGGDVRNYYAGVRARFILDHEAGVGYFMAYRTHGRGGSENPALEFSVEGEIRGHPPDYPNSLRYTNTEGGGFAFDFRLVNSQTPKAIAGVSPAIHGAMQVRPASNGQVTINWVSTNYPSMEMFRDSGSTGSYTTTVVARHSETSGSPKALLGGTYTFEKTG